MRFVVRDPGLLAGSIARCQASVFGEDAYPTLAGKIAALIESINRSHPLIDGNKRLSWVCTTALASLNGCDLVATPTDADLAFRAVAASGMSLAELTRWVEDRLVRGTGEN